MSIDRIIENVSASMAMEGMSLTGLDISRIRACLEQEVSFDETVETLVERYKQ